MPSFPSSPTTPRHHRSLSTMDAPSSPTSPQSPSHPSARARRSSSYSSHASSQAPRPRSARQHSFEDTTFAGFGAPPESNGLGSLADELAEAWDEDDDDLSGVPQDSPRFEPTTQQPQSPTRSVPNSEPSPTSNHRPQLQFHHDMDFGFALPVEPSPPFSPRYQNGLRPQSPTKRRRAHLASSVDYDGSDYGSDSDLADPGPFTSPSLDLRLSLVENLARQGTETLENDPVFERVTGELRDLKAQVGVENGVTRYAPLFSPTSHSLAPSELQQQQLTALTQHHPPASSPPTPR